MKFEDCSITEIIEFFESAPTTDFNFLYKFYKTYMHIVYALEEAFSGYAYQKDLFDIYIRFYAQKEVKYSMFSRLIKEMEEANLLGSVKGDSKVVYLKSKAYTLIGINHSTIHHSRINKDTLDKMHNLYKLHMMIPNRIPNYHPRGVTQCENFLNLYYIGVAKDKSIEGYLICKEGKSSELLYQEYKKAIDELDKRRAKYKTSKELTRLYVVATDVEAKKYKTAFEKLMKNVVYKHRKDLKISRIIYPN